MFSPLRIAAVSGNDTHEEIEDSTVRSIDTVEYPLQRDQVQKVQTKNIDRTMVPKSMQPKTYNIHKNPLIYLVLFSCHLTKAYRPGTGATLCRSGDYCLDHNYSGACFGHSLYCGA